MPRVLNATLHYFRPSTLPIWEWSETSDMITWSNGATIAFCDEVSLALEQFNESELPDFNSIVLCLAAMGSRWETNNERCRLLQLFKRLLPETSQKSESAPDKDSAILLHYDFTDSLKKQLDKLHHFANTHKNINKSELIYYILEHHSNSLGREQSSDVIQSFNLHFPGASLDKASDLRPVREALLELCNVLENINFDQLENIIRSGLPHSPQSIDTIDLPLVDKIQQALAEIEKEGEWAGIQALVQDLRASVHVPRHISNPDQLRDGGFGDISNKGTPDKLLLSELANDTDLLMARLAMNEALYLERETPKQKKQTTRNIYIENGIRMWGLPRVFAVAMALALALDQKNNDSTRWYFISGIDIVPVDLSTSTGIKETLIDLHHAAYPRCPVITHDDDTEQESFFICHQQTQQDAANYNWLNSQQKSIPFLCALNETGHYQLYHQQSSGKTLIKEATLNLDDIIHRESPTDTTLLEYGDAPIPDLLQRHPFPLRISIQADPRTSYWHDGLYSINPIGQLLLHDKPKRGARMLCCLKNTPTNYWLCSDYSGIIYVVGVSKSNASHYDLEVMAIDVDKNEKVDEWFRTVPADTPLSVRKINNHLILVARNGAYLFHSSHSDFIEFYPQDILHSYDGLHFQTKDHVWYRLFISEEEKTRLSSSIAYEHIKPNKLHTLICFDIPHSDGSWIIDHDLNMLSTKNELKLQFTKPSSSVSTTVNWISSDRARISITADKQYVLRTKFGNNKTPSKPDRSLFPTLASDYCRPNHSTRNRFQAITIQSRMICLQTLKGKIIGLDLKAHDNVWRHQKSLPQESKWYAFKNIENTDLPEGINIIATDQIEDFRAWIDKRGFLIIQGPDDSAIISIQDGQCAIALSDGTCCGKEYFLNDEADSHIHCLSGLRKLIVSFGERM